MGESTLMAQNNFKAFATAVGANVLSQADWEVLAALASGFQSGKANSAQMNKAYRQSSMIAAMVGQFIANSGVDALDNGDVAGLVTKFTNALTANLGLGTAAKKNVGTGSEQIPDMSSFTTGYTETGSTWTNTKSGWCKRPDGIIEQWGVFGFASGQTGTNVVFPVPFPTRVESIILSQADIQEAQLSPTAQPAYGVNSVGVTRTGFTGRMSGAGGFNLCYMAKGR